MSSGHGERYDFFLSRRGSVAAIAREVADVLTEKGYKVLVQDYDIPVGASFIEAMHEAVKNSRDLVILFTRDYEQSPYTRKEFTSFEAERAQSAEERHIVVLRCEDVPLRGLLADNVYQDLVGIDDPEERKRRIVAAAERQSQAVPPPPRPFIGVPPRIASFTGRADELDRLDAILMHDKPAAVTQAVGRVSVQGMGGVGKTSLAVEYAHRYRRLYAGVSWCPAETRTGLLSTLAGLSVTLGAAAADEADIEKAAKAVVGRLSEQRATWLLIYDNVSSPDEIADLLPSAGARVLITSRFSDWAAMADEVALDVLPPEEAMALLQSRTGRNDASGARMLAEALGYLPLALDHAAAYCKRTHMRFADYATKASSLIDVAPRGAGYPRSVAATFNLAVADAVAQCQAAETLMAYLAQCAPERIPMMLIEGAVGDGAEHLEALAALAEVSLVKHDPFEDGTPAVTVHRLVQAIGRARSKAKGMDIAAARHVTFRLAAVYPIDGLGNPQSWTLCAQLAPHALAQRDALSNECPNEDLAHVLNRMGSYLHGRGDFRQAELLFREALAKREEVLGSEHPDTATSLNNLALLLQSRGDLAVAQPLFERALVIREKVQQPDHPDLAVSLDNLASLLHDLGHLAQARPLYERALLIRERTAGPEHPVTARSLNNLALLFKYQGDLVGARSLYERALAIDEKSLGLNHPATATALNNLARVLQEQGDLAGARPLLERAMAIKERTNGPDHPDTALCLANLGRLLQDEGNLSAAQSCFERALRTLDKTLGFEHPNANRLRLYQARLLLAARQPSEALPVIKTALTAHEKNLGSAHPWTLDDARVTADALDALGRTEEAKALRERYGLVVLESPRTS